MTVDHRPLPKLNSLILPWPVKWEALFGAERPLIVEIGFGRGAFLRYLASLYPNANIVGLEISNQCLVKAENAITREGLDNVRVIHSRAETALHHLFEPETIAQLHINFPDPWFKRGHSHRRLLQRDTLDAIVSRLAPGGHFFLATDILAYAQMSASLLRATPGLSNQLDADWADALPNRIVTKYEAKARIEGRRCYYFHYRRNSYPAPIVPVIKDWPMPHCVLTVPLSLEAIAEAFNPFTTADPTHASTAGGQIQMAQDLTVSFMAVYRGNGSLLFEIHVSEPTIEQHTALILSEHRRTPGEYTLQLSSIGHPRPTQGMHLAVETLCRWLTSLHPAASIRSHKIQSAE
ncbi:MAG: tRNA (guanosine(46)-N7)-methyltransferase TrmB [Aggregatilineales bacterium]